MSCVVTHTWMSSPLLPQIPLWAAYAAQQRATRVDSTHIKECIVMGGTTSAVSDVGGASIRLKMTGPALPDGGYLLAIRSEPGTWLPAIAGVPGRRYGDSRVGLAELMVLARPLQGQGPTQKKVTFLPTPVLNYLYPRDGRVQLIAL